MNDLEASSHPEAVRVPRVQSVAKAVDILVLIARSPSGLRAIEVVKQLGLSKQATYHLLHTLVTTGMLTKGPDNHYLLGLRVGALAEGFSRHLAPPERLTPFVRQAAQRTGETAYAVGWVQGEIVTLGVARGQKVIAVADVPHGYYADAHSRASGKLMLALADERHLRDYLLNHPLRRRTSSTIVDRSELEAELRRIRLQGYATDDEEFAEGLFCLAVPFSEGEVPYALCVSGPTERMKQSLPQLLNVMHEITGSRSWNQFPVAAVGAGSRPA